MKKLEDVVMTIAGIALTIFLLAAAASYVIMAVMLFRMSYEKV